MTCERLLGVAVAAPGDAAAPEWRQERKNALAGRVLADYRTVARRFVQKADAPRARGEHRMIWCIDPSG
jgi:hypothetical protein